MSYSCDSTETEQAAQHLLKEWPADHITYEIKHPVLGLPDHEIIIAIIDSQVVIMIQDLKHGLKTSWNNLFTGVKLLTLGNHIAMYAYAHDLAFGPDSPLYYWDMEKTNRQDDNAATCITSSGAVVYLAKYHPDHLGFIIYLFIFGELVDAYQNWKILQVEHIKMALQARFFCKMWQSFLKAAGYSESQCYISHEFTDIMWILVDGLISLVIIYRDHLGSNIYLLMPWLHSSETCKHIFAECRKLIKDFTFLDFLYMIPRLTILICTMVKLGHTTSPNAWASRYAHTYFDPEDTDTKILSEFSTDREIEQAAQEVWEEADGLFSNLRESPLEFMGPKPSISSWYGKGQDPVPGQSAMETDEESTSSDKEIDDEDDLSEDSADTAQLQNLIEAEEMNSTISPQANNKILLLTCAAVAVEVDNIMFVYIYSAHFLERVTDNLLTVKNFLTPLQRKLANGLLKMLQPLNTSRSLFTSCQCHW